jgi:hypothetical protein
VATISLRGTTARHPATHARHPAVRAGLSIPLPTVHVGPIIAVSRWTAVSAAAALGLLAVVVRVALPVGSWLHSSRCYPELGGGTACIGYSNGAVLTAGTTFFLVVAFLIGLAVAAYPICRLGGFSTERSRRVVNAMRAADGLSLILIIVLSSAFIGYALVCVGR